MAAIDMKNMSNDEMDKFIDSFDTVLTDCDGVLWFHTSALPNAAEVMNTFRDLGKKVFYVTNNSTKTREEFSEKCEVLNFVATPEDILCTAYLTACYLKDINFTKKVYVIGSTGITKELDRVGIRHIGVGPDPVLNNSPYEAFEMDPEVGAVIVGFDEHFSYRKMMKAASYLNDKNVHFIATNTDERFPTSGSLVIPGTGSLVRCIETCAERKAIVMGKPETYVADMLTKHYKIESKRTLMIGDRANTDILLGTRCGFQTLLVLSGVTSLEEVERWRQSDIRQHKDCLPRYYTQQLGDLLPHLQRYIQNRQKS